METESFLTFFVGDRQCCINVRDIQEVASIENYQDVPKAPSCIKGVSAHRGRIITLVEPSEIFPIACDRTLPFNAVILSQPHAHIALSVYSDLHMRDRVMDAAVSNAEGTGFRRGELLPYTQIEMERGSMTLLNARGIIAFCEERILNLFKIGKSGSGEGTKVSSKPTNRIEGEQ